MTGSPRGGVLRHSSCLVRSELAASPLAAAILRPAPDTTNPALWQVCDLHLGFSGFSFFLHLPPRYCFSYRYQIGLLVCTSLALPLYMTVTEAYR